MTRLLATIVTLAWGLWFGGTIMLFMAVTSLFETFGTDKATAGRAASAIFQRFNYFELVVGAVAMLGAVGWRMSSPRHASRVLGFLFIGAWVMVLASVGAITPRIEAMRQAGEVSSQAFKHLHAASMVIYLVQAILLLLAGVWLQRVAASRRA